MDPTSSPNPDPPDRLEFLAALLTGAFVIVFGHADAQTLTAGAAALGSLVAVRGHRPPRPRG